MPSLRPTRKTAFALVALAVLSFLCPHSGAQAALLMEQPYGFFGALNPTGHTAIYFERVCAETPVKLRRCRPGELGAVISRYQGMGGYDWVAIPLIPYLYSVENASEVPSHATHAQVKRLRDRYHEEHLLSLGEKISRGNFFHGGWSELVGVSYQRRIYAYRFQTTQAQDDTFIARMNAEPNDSHFQLLFNNCSDFARSVLDEYFPRTFGRSIFPDAGMTTPKQITYKLVRYAKKHPETNLRVYEIPQIPGSRRMSRGNKDISESLVTTAYAIPIVIVNPYLAGGLFVDYLVRGRHHLIPRHPQMLGPQDMAALTAPAPAFENPVDADAQTLPVVVDDSAEPGLDFPANPALNITTDPGLTEMTDLHEQ
ncbi:MAG TPA: hypothetical protein VFU55_12560 [Terracidiphilus sp.]|nr:hypothetical protein [Terracidiphilus sp.]